MATAPELKSLNSYSDLKQFDGKLVIFTASKIAKNENCYRTYDQFCIGKVEYDEQGNCLILPVIKADNQQKPFVIYDDQKNQPIPKYAHKLEGDQIHWQKETSIKTLIEAAQRARDEALERGERANFIAGFSDHELRMHQRIPNHLALSNLRIGLANPLDLVVLLDDLKTQDIYIAQSCRHYNAQSYIIADKTVLAAEIKHTLREVCVYTNMFNGRQFRLLFDATERKVKFKRVANHTKPKFIKVKTKSVQAKPNPVLNGRLFRLEGRRRSHQPLATIGAGKDISLTRVIALTLA